MNNKLFQQPFLKHGSWCNFFESKGYALMTSKHGTVNHAAEKEFSKSFRGLTIPEALVRNARRSNCF